MGTRVEVAVGVSPSGSFVGDVLRGANPIIRLENRTSRHAFYEASFVYRKPNDACITFGRIGSAGRQVFCSVEEARERLKEKLDGQYRVTSYTIAPDDGGRQLHGSKVDQVIVDEVDTKLDLSGGLGAMISMAEVRGLCSEESSGFVKGALSAMSLDGVTEMDPIVFGLIGVIEEITKSALIRDSDAKSRSTTGGPGPAEEYTPEDVTAAGGLRGMTRHNILPLIKTVRPSDHDIDILIVSLKSPNGAVSAPMRAFHLETSSSELVHAIKLFRENRNKPRGSSRRF